jgi:hypothetical protein
MKKKTRNRRERLLMDLMRRYCDYVENGMHSRWEKLEVGIYDTAPHEVSGALIARQATLAIYLARSPSTWNGHVAPLYLRAMVDAHISLAWVLGDPAPRAKEFILYGLGQEKLFIEHLKAGRTGTDEDDPRIDEMIKMREGWLNSQRRDFMVEVNVGAWSGHNTREMAEQAGCESLYKYAYLPFSGAAHSMWQHVGIYNLTPCTNPLHKRHRVPSVARAPLDVDFVYRGAKYVSRSYELFDTTFGLKDTGELPEEWFIREMDALYEHERQHGTNMSEAPEPGDSQRGQHVAPPAEGEMN